MSTKSHFFLKLSDSLRNGFSKLKQLKSREYLLLPGVITCIIVALFLPLVFISYSTYKRYQVLVQAQERLTSLEIKAKKTALVRSRASSFVKQLQMADKFFIKNRLESLSFLQKEQENIEIFLKTSVMKESESLLERQKKLHRNRLSFEEVKTLKQENIQEKIYKLKNSIEVDAHDLQTLLNTIESPAPSFSHLRPQYILQAFILKRKNISHNYQLFECDFKLLERNFMEAS